MRREDGRDRPLCACATKEQHVLAVVELDVGIIPAPRAETARPRKTARMARAPIAAGVRPGATVAVTRDHRVYFTAGRDLFSGLHSIACSAVRADGDQITDRSDRRPSGQPITGPTRFAPSPSNWHPRRGSENIDRDRAVVRLCSRSIQPPLADVSSYPQTDRTAIGSESASGPNTSD